MIQRLKMHVDMDVGEGHNERDTASRLQKFFDFFHPALHAKVSLIKGEGMTEVDRGEPVEDPLRNAKDPVELMCTVLGKTTAGKLRAVQEKKGKMSSEQVHEWIRARLQWNAEVASE